jgi:hypothetical protein
MGIERDEVDLAGNVMNQLCKPLRIVHTVKHSKSKEILRVQVVTYSP